MDFENQIIYLKDTKTVVDWLHSNQVRSLKINSNEIKPNDVFVAWPGLSHDARIYVPLAFERGAKVCLVEREGLAAAVTNWPAHINPKMVACVSNLKKITGEIASEFYLFPSKDITVIAITGTNGKTSTAWWIGQSLLNLGVPCGVMGTLGIGFPSNKNWAHTGLTTPDPVTIHHTLRGWGDEGVLACAIEASSIGLQECRLNGLHIRTAVFTNFTQDHLDYHQTMEAYWDAKKSLFDFSSLEAVVINTDDIYGAKLAQQLAIYKKNINIWTYSKKTRHARLSCTSWRSTATGLEFSIKERGCQAQMVLKTQFVGAYNISNLLGVICTLRTVGIPLPTAVHACASLTAVPGRMQVVKTSDDNQSARPLVLVDYAHTPDALEQALVALRPLTSVRNGKLHVVIGCGGNRDTAKRPLMANIAEQYADVVWFTSDNPRNENVEQIFNQMMAGLKSGFHTVHVIKEREQAIRTAILSASAADLILIAGKGHEATQEVNGVKYPFSDEQHAQKTLHLYANTVSPSQCAPKN